MVLNPHNPSGAGLCLVLKVIQEKVQSLAYMQSEVIGLCASERLIKANS